MADIQVADTRKMSEGVSRNFSCLSSALCKEWYNKIYPCSLREKIQHMPVDITNFLQY